MRIEHRLHDHLAVASSITDTHKACLSAAVEKPARLSDRSRDGLRAIADLPFRLSASNFLSVEVTFKRGGVDTDRNAPPCAVELRLAPLNSLFRWEISLFAGREFVQPSTFLGEVRRQPHHASGFGSENSLRYSLLPRKRSGDDSIPDCQVPVIDRAQITGKGRFPACLGTFRRGRTLLRQFES